MALVLASCGGGDEGQPEAPPPAVAADFPDPPRGSTLAELRESISPESVVLSPSVSVLEAGEENRFGFGLFDAARRQIVDASAAVYVARVGDDEVLGPYPARAESLEVAPPYQSEGTASDPESAQFVYVADIPFERPGRYEVLGVARRGDDLIAATSAGGAMEVVADSPVPDIGDPAPKVSTPTVTSVAGDIESIDTRRPTAPALHEEDFADVVGERPALLLFATPALCASRVCGPVVDIALEVQAERAESGEGDEVEFIHMEVFQDNDPNKGFRPQLAAFDLPTEPWAFAIDRDGRVAARLEGAFSATELEDAVEAAARG